MTTATATTVGELFAAAVVEYADEPALQTPDGTVSWTWREYGRQSAAAAAALPALGVRHGSVIALWLSNRPEFHTTDIAPRSSAPLRSRSTPPSPPSRQPTSSGRRQPRAHHRAGLPRARTRRYARAAPPRSSRSSASTTRTQNVELDHLLHGPVTARSSTSSPPPGAGRRPADDHLHVGHDRPAEGRRAHPRQRRSRSCEATSAGLEPTDRLRVISYLPMAHIAERLVTHYLPIAHGWHVTYLRRPAAIAGRCWPRSAPAGLLLAAADVGEAARGDDRPARRATPTADRAASARPRRGPRRHHRRRARARPRSSTSRARSACRCARSTACPRRPASRPSTRRGALRAGTVGRARCRASSSRSSDDRRGPHARPDRDARLPRPPRRDRRGDRRRRLDALRRRRRLRRRRLPADRRPHQGADHQRRRQEHVAGEHRGDDQGRRLADRQRLRDRRRAALQRRARHAGRRDAADGRRADDPEVLAAVDAQVQRANERLARVEQIKRFTVLPRDWLADGDELTPTSKLKRRAIAAKYATEIEGMYAES